ncbi:ring finger domain-containing [Trichoderma cornu-damae]|uniref:RING-type E3 ubiquitin transferase n=1 Tax=Trichoderma cornu-damae TaxID=654480 RepID=A0A9P8TZ16_9HYPO|nr:ring finger domain-containing [Trichoderma cornu-damae]
MQSVLFAVLGLLAAATSADGGDGVTTSPQSNVPPEWATNAALQMNLSTPGGQTNPLEYTVIPLIPNVGLNPSNSSSGHMKTMRIDGTIIATDVTNFNKITNPNDVAFLSCDDPPSDTFITTNTILNDLISADPRAIVLYSLAGTWCSLDFTTPPAYSNILSMADSGEAQQVLGFLNGTDKGQVVNVSITGNASAPGDNPSGGGGSSSAVAMSILYTITGLVTLLFLGIIATGAVRAHRYPERYGPRSALGGRPRQSRAKGLARAVLETLPIVKFNNQESTKPDPELELDTATTDGRDARTQKSASILTEDARHEAAAAAAGGDETNDAAAAAAAGSHVAAEASHNPVGNVGCSICTEDFTEGEDMRVLPCNHQFHPNCIDPWLINISGTCPLCRLDLRPEASEQNDTAASDMNSALPPPLVLEGEDGEGSHAHHRNRISRFFDINRLRQATAEEQMEALRQMRSTRQDDAEAPEAGGVHDAERERGQRAHLSAKLKEKFRIRTRARSPERREN